MYQLEGDQDPPSVRGDVCRGHEWPGSQVESAALSLLISADDTDFMGRRRWGDESPALSPKSAWWGLLCESRMEMLSPVPLWVNH